MAHKTDVFLSHNWGKDKLGRENHDRVSLINEGLKTYGFETWFDTERVKDEILSEVADGIDNTQGVIAFITQDYHDKVNGEKTNDFCKLEFDYAVKKKSPAKMLAVGMEKDMCDSDKWTKTVGIIFAKKLFIDMSGDLHDQNYFRQKIELLKNRLEACGIKPSNSVNRNEGSMQLPKGTFIFTILCGILVEPNDNMQIC